MNSKKRLLFQILSCLLAMSLALHSIADAREEQPAQSRTLEEVLLAEPPTALSEAALMLGDPKRGAIIFHSTSLACSKCHQPGQQPTTGGELGPDLSHYEVKPTDKELVLAVLMPSVSIRKGWESVVISTSDGRTLTGIIVEDTENVISIRDLQTGQLTKIDPADVDERKDSDVSIMPPGQVNQLENRQAFLDLISYLIAIRDGGKSRAHELQPSAEQLAFRLPEYESHIDHAGMIRSWNGESFERGRKIYEQTCRNCHGDKVNVGSLPTALRFAEGRFKQGNDPYTMYQTLTSGFGMMVPQRWMVPQQKYDVIHYIQHEYLKANNPEQYFAVTEHYLNGLPKGDTSGPEPVHYEPWSRMDYGPVLTHTFESGEDGTRLAYKAVATRLDDGPGGIAQGNAWAAFDHDTLRLAFAWHADESEQGSRFIDWNGIQFNGQHFKHPHLIGKKVVENPNAPGWANPATGRFEDTERILGRDDRRYGPLPRAWGRYLGHYAFNGRTIFSYTIGGVSVLEMPGLAPQADIRDSTSASYVFTRTFEIGPRSQELKLLVTTRADAQHFAELTPASVALSPIAPASEESFYAVVYPRNQLWKWSFEKGRLSLTIPPGESPLNFTLAFTTLPAGSEPPAFTLDNTVPPQLSPLRYGGAPAWNQQLTSAVLRGSDKGPFAVDTIVLPDGNPWFAQMRPTGLDFLPDGDSMVLCTWDGDVWLITGLLNDAQPAQVTWRRIANGLFQPLGIKLVDGRVYVTCRDQIVILNDLNGDGETDFYECLNNDHQVTEHFHEFAMGLQVDAQKNLYYAKSARHALPAVVPHHGTLIRVSPDGSRSEVIARGFRAANGVCLNPDGTFFVTDQEGHWTPKNRINLVREGGFYGNLFGYHELDEYEQTQMEKPICWITNAFDRSPAELLWVKSPQWGRLDGKLLNLSYGEGKIYIVPYQSLNGTEQGGMCELPIAAAPTGLIRGRFNPADDHLYVCGMFSWAGNRQQPGGLYRIRATGKPSFVPIDLEVLMDGIRIEWSDEIDAKSACDASNYQVRVWDLKRTANYGSEHLDERLLPVRDATLADNRRSLTLNIPDISTTWCMEIRCRIKDALGESHDRVIHNSIHVIPRAE